MSKSYTIQELKALAEKMKAAKEVPEQRVAKEGVVFGGPFKEIPKFILDCFEVIENTPRQGLFRRCGAQKEIEDARKRIDLGEDVDMKSIHVFNCCSLVKLYFRSMPQSLFNPTQSFLNIGHIETRKARLQKLKEVIDTETPTLNRSLILKLASLCHDLTQNPTILMDSKNLAIVLVPNFFPLSSSAPATTMLTTLIDYYPSLFPSKRQLLHYDPEYSHSSRYGIPNPEKHIRVKDSYNRWLQHTKNIARSYKIRSGRPMFEVYSVMCEEIFVRYHRLLCEDRSLVGKVDECARRLEEVLRKVFKEKLDFELDGGTDVLERLVWGGIEILGKMFRLSPPGRFEWVRPGDEYLEGVMQLKGSRVNKGQLRKKRKIVVKRCLFPGFVSGRMVFCETWSVGYERGASRGRGR